MWPLLAGPLLGLALSLIPGVAAHFPQSATVEFGFGVGVFLGLVVDFAILLFRRQFLPRTWLVGGAAVIVLVGLVRALLI